VSAPLNLAREPFRNERLPTLALALGCAVLLGVTARHALLARDLLPGRVGHVEKRLVGLEQEIETLGNESAELRRLSAPAPRLKEWLVVKGLVDRRAFSWTGLFAALEKVLPPGVRLLSVAPQPGDGPIELTLIASGRTVEDALALLKALQANPDFQGAFPNGVTEGKDGVDINCTVRYAPRAQRGGTS
jgi:Tfp pilus assembly protein PilN